MTHEEFLTRFLLGNASNVNNDYPFPGKLKDAAVLIPVMRHEQGASLLLTERALHLKHHPGQIAFPGGKYEDSVDSDYKDTALRETFEETGIKRPEVDIVGQLSLYKTITGYAVRPFIGMVSPQVNFEVDANEVNQVFEVPLSYAMNPKNYQTHTMRRPGFEQLIYFLPYKEHLIWGATAAMMWQLCRQINHKQSLF